MHTGLYLLMLLMVGTGYATGILAGLPDIVLAESGDPLPASFSIYPTFIAHGILAALLAGSIALHVAAALYHQLVRKDRLLGRMLFGRRIGDPGLKNHRLLSGCARPLRRSRAARPDDRAGTAGG